MNSNVKYIGSTNIIQLGFQAFFNLDLKVLLLDITGQTLFNSGGAAAVLGISFNITAPGGLVLDTVDFSSPDIDPSVGNTFQLNLPDSFGVFGWYSIQAVIKDADGAIYSTAIIRKEICQPEGYVNNNIPGLITVMADTDVPQILISETTPMVYKGLSPTGVTKAGVLRYPAGTLADLNFDYTPVVIAGSGNVFTGRYIINNKSIATYDLSDGILLMIPYVVRNQEKVVDTNSAVSQVLCCVKDVFNIYARSPYSASGKAAKEKLDSIQTEFYIAIMKEKSGENADEEIEIIKKALGCDCCESSAIESRPVFGVGANAQLINIIGNNASDVSSSIAGSTKTYTVNTKSVVVEKADSDDLGFNITEAVSDSQIVYDISFNYAVIASGILAAIQDDQDLITFLNSLIVGISPAISLNGFLGKCIIAAANCNYSLIEPSTPVKIINSITIAGTVHTAPGSLLLTNTSAILTWLNGLSLGTFLAVYDAGAGTVIIQSNGNPNAVTQLSLQIGGSAVLRTFTKTCIGLVDILNAICTYVCALDATKIAFGMSLSTISSFNTDGTVKQTTLSPTLSLATVIDNILKAQTVLYNKIASIGLTCGNVKTLFAVSADPFGTTDFMLGTKNNNCARLTAADVAAAVLAAIAADTAVLKPALCAITASCVAPTCSAPTNVSVVFTEGNDCAPVTGITGTVS